jgi:hypothetical protein
MLVENARRRDLSSIEEAHGYQRVLDLGEFTAAKIGKAIGVPTCTGRGPELARRRPVEEHLRHALWWLIQVHPGYLGDLLFEPEVKRLLRLYEAG